MEDALDRVERLIHTRRKADHSRLIPVSDDGRLVPNADYFSENVKWLVSPHFVGTVRFLRIHGDSAVFVDDREMELNMSVAHFSLVAGSMVEGRLVGTFGYVRRGDGFAIEFMSPATLEDAPVEWEGDEADEVETPRVEDGLLREWDA